MTVAVMLFGVVAGLLSGGYMLVQGHGLLAALAAYPLAGMMGAVIGLGLMLLRQRVRHGANLHFAHESAAPARR